MTGKEENIKSTHIERALNCVHNIK